MRRRFALPVLAMLVAGGVLAAPPPAAEALAPLALTATPVPLDADDPARVAIGRLRYLGGLALRSPNERFGGISGLRAGPAGRFLAVTDNGNWLAFTVIERDGRLTGVTNAWIAPLRDAEGRPARTKDDGDAEALEWDPATGDATVVFEQRHRLQRYAGIDPARPATLDRAAIAVFADPAWAAWLPNSGGEAFARLGDGAVAISEGTPGPGGDGREAQRRRGAQVERFGYPNPRGFSPTDMIAEGPATLLVLNRRFSPASGAAAAVLRWRLGPDGGTAELARLAAPLTVDNMEGIALTRTGGRTFVWLVSDDNFNRVQRTLLLKFELLG